MPRRVAYNDSAQDPTLEDKVEGLKGPRAVHVEGISNPADLGTTALPAPRLTHLLNICGLWVGSTGSAVAKAVLEWGGLQRLCAGRSLHHCLGKARLGMKRGRIVSFICLC